MSNSCGNCCSQTIGRTAEVAVVSFSGNQIIGKITNYVVSTFTCQRNIKIIQGVFVLGPTFFIAGINSLWKFFLNSQPSLEQIIYKPFALLESELPAYINVFKDIIKTKGTSGNDLIISHPNGSEVFAIGGLNYLIANEGIDKFYFSLCSTDIIDNKVSVIQGFNSSQDQIKFFCTKVYIYSENITILHENINDTDITYVHVAGSEKNSSIALIGNIDLNSTDIILNEKWPYT